MNIIQNIPENLPKNLFLVQAIISCFTCYARSDYNLALFAFAYILWDNKPIVNNIYTKC